MRSWINGFWAPRSCTRRRTWRAGWGCGRPNVRWRAGVWSWLAGEAVLVGDRYFPLDAVETRQPERSIEELTLRMPSSVEARHLGIREGVPVVRVLRTLYDPAERPLEVSDVLLAGANLLEVKRRAGHERSSFTMDRYGHLFPNADEDLARRLDELGDNNSRKQRELGA
ncbi:MAG: UTRA domain-containing protein [Egibacteraceae bacterium]